MIISIIITPNDDIMRHRIDLLEVRRFWFLRSVEVLPRQMVLLKV